MARKYLTARFCEAVKVEKRTDFWDDVVRGLILRVSPNGTKAWTVVYVREIDGSKRRFTLGRFPAISLEKARTRALKAATAVSEGDDPSEQKRARKTALTVEDIGRLYLEKHAKRHKRTWREDERVLSADVYPRIGKIKAVAVKRRDLLDILEAKTDAGKLTSANRLLAVIRKLFNWAVEQDYLQVSPVAGIKPPGKAVRRDRVLTNYEIATIWQTLPNAALADQTRDIFRLLFLTGQRSGEVCGMRRDEIDMMNAIWTIPGSRTKNGLTHVVPLARPAIEIVQKWHDGAGEGDDAPLFTRTGEPIASNAIAHAARLRLQVAKSHWTPHDIRRTVATGMAGIGIAPHFIEACLNHISGFKAGVAGTYNRNTYEPEKRRALDIWGEHIGAVVEGRPDKVVPINVAAR